MEMLAFQPIKSKKSVTTEKAFQGFLTGMKSLLRSRSRSKTSFIRLSLKPTLRICDGYNRHANNKFCRSRIPDRHGFYQVSSFFISNTRSPLPTSGDKLHIRLLKPLSESDNCILYYPSLTANFVKQPAFGCHVAIFSGVMEDRGRWERGCIFRLRGSHS